MCQQDEIFISQKFKFLNVEKYSGCLFSITFKSINSLHGLHVDSHGSHVDLHGSHVDSRGLHVDSYHHYELFLTCQVPVGFTVHLSYL